MSSDMNILNVYTDGACSATCGRGHGGAAFYVVEKDLKGKYVEKEITTNQRMELMACITALETILKDLGHSFYINIHSDSAYICNCFKQGWHLNWINNGWINSKKEPVANRDLWERLLNDINEFVYVNFIKVKGHSDCEENNIVDKLAKEAVMEAKRYVSNSNSSL